MKIYTIYKITNQVNNKCYIGFTDNFYRRKAEHIRQSKSRKRNYPIYNAMQKYGEENFTWDILYQSLDLEHTLHVVEPMLIKEHDAEYNLAVGGTAPMLHRKHSEATIAKMRQRVPWNKGKQFSAKSRKRMSEAQKRRSPNLVRIHNQAESNRSWWRITLPSGEEIIVKGLAKWCKARGLSAGNMSRLHSGQIKYYKGYKCEKLGKGVTPPIPLQSLLTTQYTTAHCAL